MRDVTFGITTFERPKLLQNLVRSILQRYPSAKIVVADNGKQTAVLPDSVRRLNLPFDCGLSRARNALVDALETEYLLILEDDFLFNDQTKIEPMLKVLESDREIGVVGGAMRSIHGRISAYALDIEVFRKTMYVREATHRLCFTDDGLPYRLCDMVWNFALFRREMLADHRWIDRLKVGEHCPYFHQVKLAQKWRVAMCAETQIEHVSQNRPANYLKYRQRAQKLFESYLSEHGIEDYKRVLPFHFEDDESDKPSVIVLGVGHSGTSILSKMLEGLGWNAADADQQFGESVAVRRINRLVEATGRFPRRHALQVLESIPRPWVLKDPRFVNTLHYWMPLFQLLEQKPALIRIRRDRNSLLASYARRKAPGNFTQRVERNLEACQRTYDRWPWMRLSVDYERIAMAVKMFDPARVARGAVESRGSGEPNAATSSGDSGFAGGINEDSVFGQQRQLSADITADSGFGRFRALTAGIETDSMAGNVNLLSTLEKISELPESEMFDLMELLSGTANDRLFDESAEDGSFHPDFSARAFFSKDIS